MASSIITLIKLKQRSTIDYCLKHFLSEFFSNALKFKSEEKIYRPITSVVRQKWESQNGGYKKTKHAKFSTKLTFLIP